MRVLYLEPFDAGSHRDFGQTLMAGLPEIEWDALTLPGRHWKWRMRGSAAWYAALLSKEKVAYDLIFASSYVALAEIRGLAPWLGEVPAILYFHENQFGYPTRPLSETPGRVPSTANDHGFGFAQMVSALAANRVLFNSEFNRTSFLDGARALLRRLPDAKRPGWVEEIESKSEVLGLPLHLEPTVVATAAPETELGPIILWNHRWEHDKAPELFFAALRVLVAREVPFRVIVAGQRFRKAPPVFEHAREWLPPESVIHWGYAESRAEYTALLSRADIAVSTAKHEFFGIAMLEAAHHGAWPLVPDALSYRELFPAAHRYEGSELFDRLEALCRRYSSGEVLRGGREFVAGHSARLVLPRYRSVLASTATSRFPQTCE